MVTGAPLMLYKDNFSSCHKIELGAKMVRTQHFITFEKVDRKTNKQTNKQKQLLVIFFTCIASVHPGLTISRLLWKSAISPFLAACKTHI